MDMHGGLAAGQWWQAGRPHTKDKAEPAEATRSKLKRMLALERRFLETMFDD